MADQSIEQERKVEGVPLSPEVARLLRDLDREEVEILRKLINAVRSATTVGKWLAGALLGGIALMVAISQLPDAVRKIKAWLFVLAFAVLSAGPVFAHQAMSGWKYPFECCRDHDCAELSPDRVKPMAGGYMVDGKFHVRQKDVRWSPDGRYHGCFPTPDNLRCFFAPPMGF